MRAKFAVTNALDSFYVQDPRVTARSDAEVEAFRAEKEMKVSGDNITI